jgi:hypothetical protein
MRHCLLSVEILKLNKNKIGYFYLIYEWIEIISSFLLLKNKIDGILKLLCFKI